eukprot:scaffold2.g6922.t1
MAAASLGARVGAEALGSLMTYTLAVGGMANALLPRTKGEGAGLLAIAATVAVGVGVPIAALWRVSAFFNPAILTAAAVRGAVPAGDFFALLAAELEVALLNASYTLAAPADAGAAAFLRLAAADLRRELGRAARARKVADPFRTCVAELEAQACEADEERDGLGKAASTPHTASSDGAGEEEADGGQRAGRPAAAAPGGERGAPGQHPAGPQWHTVSAPETFASRLAGEGGPGGTPRRSRGQIAAALCKARQDVLLSVFVTRPAIWSPVFNLVQEVVATAVMATASLLLVEQARFLAPAEAALWMPLAGLAIGAVNGATVLSLGGGTGPAMNPARDLGPRLAFHLLPIPGKGCSEWHYAPVPALGGLAGGAVAGGVVVAVGQMLSAAS